MGRIPQSFIDDLLDRTDIVDVVSSRVDLKKSGKNHSACCPFHDEKTPSFTVSPDKQFYYCFGCGAGGNAIGFVMDFDRINFPQAVERLAQLAGMEVPRETSRDDVASQKRKQQQDILSQADQYYRQQLRQHPQAKTAVAYLKERGLSGDIARDFGIGYAPPGWDNLLHELGTDDASVELLIESGMLVDRPEENKRYDRFRHRIMFPIRDPRGRTIAFGGRVLGDDKPKYLNSPETRLFHKGRELYGLFEANQALRDIPSLIVVEGYMDVVALAQHGIHNAVATLGTAATAEHLDKLFRYTAEVVFCFDGDEAGRKAASRALETTLPAMQDGRTVRFLFLPDGEDPDSLVRKIGPGDFNNLVHGAQPLSDFLFDSLSANLALDSLDGKARLSKLAAPLINRVPEGVFKELMLSALAAKTGVEPGTLKTIIGPAPEPEPAGPPPEWDGPPPDYDDFADFGNYQGNHDVEPMSRPQSQRAAKRVMLTPERALIALLCNNPALVDNLSDNDLDTLRALESDDLKLFAELAELVKQFPEYTLNHILGYWRGIYGQDQAELLAEIAATDLLQPPGNSSRDNQREFSDILASLHRKSIERMPAITLFQTLAEQDSLSEFEHKCFNKAWKELFKEGFDETTQTLINRIRSKPRQH